MVDYKIQKFIDTKLYLCVKEGLTSNYSIITSALDKLTGINSKACENLKISIGSLVELKTVI